MAFSLSLSVYMWRARNRAGPRPRTIAPEAPVRPEGIIVWLDAPDAAAARRILGVARRMRAQRFDLGFVLTCPDPVSAPSTVVVVPPPPETRDGVAAFLDRWRPDEGLVAGGKLRPALLVAAVRRGVPLLALEAGAPEVATGGRWPRLVRLCLRGFSTILAQDALSMTALRRAGAPPARLRLSGQLEQPSHALAANEPERAALARAFGTRPVWLAAAVPEREEDAVAQAHQIALRVAHRLLLVIVPERTGRGEILAERLRTQHGLEARLRSMDAEIDDDMQVYVADTEDEFGLWYRLSPVAYIGGTLTGPGATRHPLEAAALGTAIVHGPVTEPETDLWARLRRAGASRRVTGAADLGEAVGELLAPDRAAAMAQAAWEIASGGEGASDGAATLALDTLDKPAAV